MSAEEARLAQVAREAALPLDGSAHEHDALLDRIGAARFVLLGEASHGTSDFYRARAEITKRLITEKGFAAVAVEADWPDAYRVNRFVRGEGDSLGLGESCEQEVVAQLVELRRGAADYARRDGRVAADELFYAEQNARLVQNAERYYRAMFDDRVSSWNLRDRHMAETLEALARHLDHPGRPARIVVWAHNSHLGDARATEMARAES